MEKWTYLYSVCMNVSIVVNGLCQLYRFSWLNFITLLYLICHELDTVGLNDLSTHNRLGPA